MAELGSPETTPFRGPEGAANPEPAPDGLGRALQSLAEGPKSLRNAVWHDGTGSRSPFWAKLAFQEPFFKNRPSGDAAGSWTVDRVLRRKEGQLDGYRDTLQPLQRDRRDEVPSLQWDQ